MANDGTSHDSGDFAHVADVVRMMLRELWKRFDTGDADAIHIDISWSNNGERKGGERLTVTRRGSD